MLQFSIARKHLTLRPVRRGLSGHRGRIPSRHLMHMMHMDEDPELQPSKPWSEWDSPLLFMLGPDLDAIP